MEKQKKTSQTLYIQVKFKVINKGENKESEPSVGRISYMHRLGFWMEVPSIEVGGMHMSFGGFSLVRNSLELIVHTVQPVDQIYINGEVEWYELIPSGTNFRFNVGVNVLDMSVEDKKKYSKLVSYFKEKLNR